MIKTDFLVIGSGIAGLNFALEAAKYGEVLVITKKEIAESNTNYAQGGIAAVLDKADSTQAHINDTMVAGSFHNDKEAVRIMVEEGPDLVRNLSKIVPFQKNKDKEILLTKEGGHSSRRIAFCGDTTGYEIEKALVKAVRHEKKITVLEHTFVTDLIVKDKTVIGASFLDYYTNSVNQVFVKAVILASGGASQIYYPHTTNPEISTGDGIAMGLLAGCKSKDLEFFQFHPTALFKKGLPTFLLSESLRGEGALLKNYKDEVFMAHYDERKELAPRDIVARSIVSEEKKGPVYLDLRHFSLDTFQKHFKNIYETLTDYGMDPKNELIPVSPAAHYTVGGLRVDHFGFTGLDGLYAFGEVACTGVHGANRLGSNSLLEALVFSHRVSQKLPELKKRKIIVENPKNLVAVSYSLPEVNRIKDTLRINMWKYAGVIRTGEGLKKCQVILIDLEKKLQKIYCINKDYFETRNMLIVSKEVVKAALKRKVSLGAHFIENLTTSHDQPQ